MKAGADVEVQASVGVGAGTAVAAQVRVYIDTGTIEVLEAQEVGVQERAGVKGKAGAEAQASDETKVVAALVASGDVMALCGQHLGMISPYSLYITLSLLPAGYLHYLGKSSCLH